MEISYKNCKICPRECGADRTTSTGFCGGRDKALVAKIMRHLYEEPCISGTRGSGGVFFSGCNLRCNYCQNRDISFSLTGEELTAEELAIKFLELQGMGVHNVNLVTATPYLPTVIPALRKAKESGLKIPVVYNSGGYEKRETVAALASLVDVWLPDFKYFDGSLAAKYSRAPDYPERAIPAIDEMVKACGEVVIEDGLIKRGVIIRHLVLPSHRDDSEKVLQTISERWGNALVSLMRQYTPEFAAPECDLKRRVTTFEYRSLLRLAENLGLRGYFQDAESASAAFTPDFRNSRG